MMRFYTDIAAKQDGYSYVPFLYPCWGAQPSKFKHPFFKHAFDHWLDTGDQCIQVVSDVNDCVMLLMPNDFALIKFHKKRFKRLLALAHQYRKKLLVFHQGDSEQGPDDESIILCKTSLYRDSRNFKKSNLIALPAYCNDVRSEIGSVENSTGYYRTQPSIGFCGYVGLPKGWARLKGTIKNWWLDCFELSSRKRGIYFRNEALKHLYSGIGLLCNFIVRDSFMNVVSAKSDTAASRQQYLENIFNSDYVLCIKGDGNYSIRFYETLSMGRIPLLVDTDCVLPLSDYIAYEKYMPIVPFYKIKQIDVIVSEFHSKLTPEQFEALQIQCRKIWENYLEPSAFFKLLFKKLEALKT